MWGRSVECKMVEARWCRVKHGGSGVWYVVTTGVDCSEVALVTCFTFHAIGRSRKNSFEKGELTIEHNFKLLEKLSPLLRLLIICVSSENNISFLANLKPSAFTFFTTVMFLYCLFMMTVNDFIMKMKELLK